jgi:AmmeMemoRadiSam system radical SAM enzyme
MINFFTKAKNYDKDKKLICQLCSHYCHLKPQQTGICGVNKNENNKIKCLVYGYLGAFNIDPIEKKPLYHFLPNSKSFSIGTVGCNFKCPFCQNWQISQTSNINKKNYTTPKDIVIATINNGCKSISYTYNEPTIFYPYIKDIATLAKQQGLKNVFVSNGFESLEVRQDMVGLIDGINIDIKSFDKKYYKKELGGDLDIILDNAIFFKKNNIWVEITTLVIPNQNDSNEELENIANFIANNLGADTPWHISAFHPDYKVQNTPRTPKQSLQNALNIGKKAGLKYVYVGNIGYKNSTYCQKCDNILINREQFNAKIMGLKDGKCQKCQTKISGVY